MKPKKKSEKKLFSFSHLVKVSTREVIGFEWRKIKSDIRVPILWVVEIVLAVVLASSIAIYLDPEVNVLEEPWNYITFSFIAIVAVWLHAFTRPFRIMRRISKKRNW